MKIVKLDTLAAGTWKRDCVITSIAVQPNLVFEFNKDSDGSEWKISFSDFISIKITSEEFTSDKCLRNLPEDGSFYEIMNSPWIEEMKWSKNKLLDKCKHFVFCFYDEVIEVISIGFSLQKVDR